MKVRVKFAKKGVMRFIGHLDIMRYFQKAIRRAKIDIAYSEGFSPHQIMSFASPLGVGLTSSGEYFDIELKSTLSSEKMVSLLNEQMVDGMEIISFRLLKEPVKNAMSCLAAADYNVTLLNSNTLRFEEFMNQKSIVIIKETKKSECEVDIRPMIFDYKIISDNQIFLKLATGSSENLKPDLVLKAYFTWLNLDFDSIKYLVERLECYMLEDNKYISLEEMGEVIEG